MTGTISLAVEAAADRARVFEILTTTEGQRGFWTADCDVAADHARFGFAAAPLDLVTPSRPNRARPRPHRAGLGDDPRPARPLRRHGRAAAVLPGRLMAVDVRPTVEVRRPRHEVAAFMFDPANDLRWTGGITSSRPAQPGPLVTGSTVERTARFLGRTFTYGYVVTDHEPDSLVELKVDRPFPMLVRYELEDAPGATIVAIHATGTPGRFFGWATPLMRAQVRKSIQADLVRLRDCLEG